MTAVEDQNECQTNCLNWTECGGISYREIDHICSMCDKENLKFKKGSGFNFYKKPE